MIAPFVYEALPMRVRFGAGVLTQLSDEVAALGLGRVLVLCSPEQDCLRRCGRTTAPRA